MTSKLKLLDQKNATGRKHDQLIASRHDRTAKAVDFAGGGGLCCASAGRKQSTGTWSMFANLQNAAQQIVAEISKWNYLFVK